MNETDTHAVPRDGRGRFAAGNPGRAFGSRNRISGRVVRAILRDFEASQDQVLATLKRWYVPQYVALVGRLLARPPCDGGSDGAEESGDRSSADGDAKIG